MFLLHCETQTKIRIIFHRLNKSDSADYDLQDLNAVKSFFSFHTIFRGGKKAFLAVYESNGSSINDVTDLWEGVLLIL